MTFNMKLWKVEQNEALKELPVSSLEKESILEDWIEKDSSILGMELLIIGRQVTTEFGGRIDLLAIDREGDIAILELKRDRTPRNIVAQVLDYASWIRRLTFKDLDEIANRYAGKDLSTAFKECFDEAIPEKINTNHKMIIVASEFDDSSHRIVEYLVEEYQININAIFFNIFTDEQAKLLGRAWLMDPEDVQDRSESRKQAPWSGFWFVNVGEGPHRNWNDNIKYGYIGAGQGPRYSASLKKLRNEDRIFAYMKGVGYVGYGIVREHAIMIKDFKPNDSERVLLDVPLTATNASDNRDDPKYSEWAVKIDWKKTYHKENARSFKGIFANQNIVCKLKHKRTVDFLITQFGVEE